MKVKFRKYEPEADFLRVRALLVNTYRAFKKPANWHITRWNYARYFVAPFLGAYGLNTSADESLNDADRKSQEAIRFWEESVGIWENETNEIVGVVNPDEHIPWHRAYGLAYFQRHPHYEFLLDEMLDYAEKIFINKGIIRIEVIDDDEPLETLVRNRGFQKGIKPCGYYLEYILKDLPKSNLPGGYSIRSMADESDLAKRCKIFGESFRLTHPEEWPTVFSYQELQKAPDYRKDLDLYVTDSHGEYVACCIAWLDDHNRIATLEPVGSIRLGMGREVVMEGLRRVAALGAETAIMDSGLRFYQAIGFKRKYPFGYRWTKEIVLP